MASYEPSEIATAVALMYSHNKLLAYSKDRSCLKDLIVDAKKKLKSMPLTGGVIQFGSSSIKAGFINELDENNEKVLKDMAVGISAAIGIRNTMASCSSGKTPTIYMTGDSWPPDVEPFKVSAYGFKDYNSSDIIVTADKKAFFGISLKKKNNPAAQSPTLINKAFDTALDETGLQPIELERLQELKQKVVKMRVKFFSEVVIESVDKGIIRWQDINNINGSKLKTISEWNTFKATAAGKEELFYATKRNKVLFPKETYIDTKGYANHKEGYLYDVTTDQNSMRYFVNSKLTDSNSPLWKSFLGVMNEYSDVFADILINIVLKTKMYEELTKQEIDSKGYKFRFYLATGVADISTKGNVTISNATVTSLKTTLCGLTRIEKLSESKKYQIVLDTEKQEKSNAAKIFFKIKRGDINILDMELRYKGSFNPQPQFQGTINEQFKKLLDKECT